MATFKPDDKFVLKNTTTGDDIPGTFGAVAAKARAIALHTETGHSIDCYVVGQSDAVAGAVDGRWLLYQPHDSEGRSLPFQDWPGDDVEN
jgi:hypothetical protein